MKQNPALINARIDALVGTQNVDSTIIAKIRFANLFIKGLL